MFTAGICVQLFPGYRRHNRIFKKFGFGSLTGCTSLAMENSCRLPCHWRNVSTCYSSSYISLADSPLKIQPIKSSASLPACQATKIEFSKISINWLPHSSKLYKGACLLVNLTSSQSKNLRRFSPMFLTFEFIALHLITQAVCNNSREDKQNGADTGSHVSATHAVSWPTQLIILGCV